MARYTIAYSAFVNNLQEVQELLVLAEKNQVDNVYFVRCTAKERRDLYITAIILLSNCIKEYIENLAELILCKVVEKRIRKAKLPQQLLYFFPKDLLDDIYNTEEPEYIAKKIKKLFSCDYFLGGSDYFNDNFRKDLFVYGFSNPGCRSIRLFFSRFGYINYSCDLENNLKSKYLLCTNMVDNVANEKNKIAHGYVTTITTPGDLADMLNLTHLFCRSTDKVIGDWFKKIGCPIR